MNSQHSTLRALWRAFEKKDGPRAARSLCQMARQGNTDPLGSFTSHPFDDDFRDFGHEAVTDYLRKRKGIVYVVANPVNAGFYKIGVTAHDVSKRLRSLKSAGVVGEFIEVDTAFALDRFAAEGAAHRRMEALVPRHKEFFVTDYKTASDAVRECVQVDNETLSKAFMVEVCTMK